ncbi:MAG: hypothetical protein JEZ09_12980 [Salinivirgaceae bacterium]|nr:hypothetical protein [Salinivirgaceae bacterium]
MPYKKHLRIVLLFSFLLISGLAFSQAYIADTIVIPYGSKEIQSSFPVNTFDYREDQPKTISVFEKKKWVFFPVDQIVNLEKSLAISFENTFNKQTLKPNYIVDIHNFYYKMSESTFKRHFKLNASIELSELQTNGDTNLMGVFYYENYNTQKAKDSTNLGYLNAIDSFNLNFEKDLDAVLSKKDQLATDENFHFRRGFSVAPKNFYTSVDIYAGLNFWGFDGELWFSSPEPDQKFKRTARMIRYMHFNNRQSVAIARKVNYLNYRISDQWLFQNKHAFLLGFNKWNDISEEKRTMEEIFMFQLTATQKITYNLLDKKGLIAGIGLMEEISYIPYNDPIFNIGLVGTLGIKF